MKIRVEMRLIKPFFDGSEKTSDVQNLRVKL